MRTTNAATMMPAINPALEGEEGVSAWLDPLE